MRCVRLRPGYARPPPHTAQGITHNPPLNLEKGVPLQRLYGVPFARRLTLASPRGAIGHLERHVRGPDRRENLNRAWSSSELDIQVNRLLGAETDLEDWIPPVLRLPSAAGRLDWFLRFNTDGLFKLILLRRLDDVLDRFPWLSARMALVSHVPLGLLGVMAQLFELGRA